MSKVAIGALVVSTLLAVFTNRWVTDPPAAGFVMVDMRWMNLGGQWRVSGQWPGLAWWGGALLVFYVAEGVPFTFDSSGWRMKNLPAAWMRGRDEERQAAASREKFAGTWQSARASYEFGADSLAIRGGGGTERVSATACEFNFMLRYRMSGPHILPATEESMKYTEGLDSELPAMEATCGNAAYAFLLRPDGTVVAYRAGPAGEVSYEILRR